MSSEAPYPDLAYSDVRNSEWQQSVADSLLGDEAQYEEQPEVEETDPDELSLDEQIADSLVDQPEQEVEEYEEEVEQEEELEYQSEPEQQQVEVTTQDIQASIQQLDQTVTELGLNDAAAAMQFAQDLTVPFGGDPSVVNSQQLGQTMAKVVVSAAQIFEQTGGDPSQAGAIPRDAAVAFTNDFLRSWGIDPRTSPVDSQQFASVMLAGTMNFIQAAQTYGLDASMDRLNLPEAAESFANAFHRCFGINQPASREYALALADAGGRYIISTLRKLEAHQQAQRPARQSQPRQSRPGRTSSGQRFRTNSDLFDEDTLSALRTRL
jgi:hypothetical protein